MYYFRVYFMAPVKLLKPTFMRILSASTKKKKKALTSLEISLIHFITKADKLKRKNEVLAGRIKELKRTAKNHLGKQIRCAL